MADPHKITVANLQDLKNSLSAPVLEPVLDRAGQEGKLGDVLALIEVGVTELSVTEESIATAVREFLKRGGKLADFERAKRRMVQVEKKLPEEFVELPSPIDDLLRLEAEMQELGTVSYEVFRDKENLAALRYGGLAGMHMRKIKAGAVSAATGVPKDIAEKQPLKDSVEGAAFAQAVGHPGAVKDPGFWTDFRKVKSGKGDLSEEEFTTRWLERAQQWDAEELKRQKDANDKEYDRFLRAKIDRELERRRRERERKAKVRAQRKRRARMITPKLEDIQIATYKDWPVITPSSAHYFVRIWDNGSTELYRVSQEGAVQVAANFAYYEMSDPRTGRLGVVPVLGIRPRQSHPASQAHAPEGQRGTLGSNE